jgi:hypothetical protein
VSSSASSSTYAAVSQITIAAPTNQLTQTVGSLSRVAFTASTNAGANPSVVEWFVNDVKSTVKGLNFEFAPTAAGTYVVQSKVGTVVSNSLTLTVGGASSSFVIESVTTIDSDTFEVKAPGGAAVSVTGKTLAATSRYDLSRGVYVVDVTTAFAQGTTATVSLVKDGVTKTEVFTFDTRKLEVASLKNASNNEITILPGGVYEITKPHTLTEQGATNTTSVSYNLVFSGTNFSSNAINFKKEVVVPAGATAVNPVEGMVTVSDINNVGSFAISLTKDSVVGNYQYKYTLDGVTSVVKVRVAAPTSEIDFSKHTKVGSTVVNTAVTKDSKTGVAPVGDYSYDLVYTQTTNGSPVADVFGVQKNVDNSYTIEKDYIAKAGFFRRFSFSLDAENFGIPTGTIDSISPNQVSVTLVGPNNTPLMFSNLNSSPTNILPTSFSFRSGFIGTASNGQLLINQTVDASTQKGTYTYTVKVLQSGLQIFSKDIVVKIEDPVAKLDLSLVNTGATALSFKEVSDLVFEVQKPRASDVSAHPLAVNLKVSNYESANDTSFVAANYFQGLGVVAGTPSKSLLAYKVSYTGPTTLSNINIDTKIGIELGVTNPVNNGSNNGVVYANNDAIFTANTNELLNSILKPETVPSLFVKSSATTATYFPYYTSATSGTIDLSKIFTFNVDYLTSPGTYTFEVRVGNLVETITVRVLAPVQATNFMISTASGSGVELKNDGKYYTTLDNESSKVVNFGLTLENMELDGTGKVNYTLATTTPDSASSTTNLITATAVSGKGHLISTDILNLLGTGTITGTGLTTLKPITLSKAGEYKYDLTVNGVRKVVTLVVLDFPRLTVDSVNVGTTQLSKFTFDTVEQYLVNSTTVTSLKLSVKGLNLPEKVYFSIAAEADKVTATAVSTSTLLTFKDGVAEIPVAILAPTTVVATTGANVVYTITVGLHTYDGTTFTEINDEALILELRANPTFA